MDTIQKESRIRELLGMSDTDIKEVEITPQIADEILDNHNEHNRNMSENVARRYAESMKEGKWHKSNDSITFDSGWDISNGQHRLRAIKIAKTPVIVVVQFNVDQNAEMDRGRQRSISDNIKLNGGVKNEELRNSVDVHQALNVMLRIGVGNTRIRTDEVIDLINNYEVELLTAYRAGILSKAQYIGRADVRAAMILAYINGVDLDTLVHIRKVLTDGIAYNEEDKPIIALRDKLLLTNGVGIMTTVERLKYTQYCIKAVVEGRKTKICKATEIYYKI